MKIANRDEVVEELANLLKNFDKELNRYQTDVYAYIDDEGKVELREFVNVGGNSWLDDDHYTIYHDSERYDGPIDYFTTVEELADAIGISQEELKAQARNYLELDDDDDIGDIDIYDFAGKKYADEIEKAFDKLDFEADYGVDYAEKAEEIIRDFEERLDEED